MDENKKKDSVGWWLLIGGLASLVNGSIIIATRYNEFKGMGLDELLLKFWGIPLGIIFLLVYIVRLVVLRKKTEGNNTSI